MVEVHDNLENQVLNFREAEKPPTFRFDCKFISFQSIMQEYKTKNGHGGRREGAGRPRTVGVTRTVTIRLPDDVAEILDRQENRSAFIVEAIRRLDEEQRKKTIIGFEISYTKERK